MGRRFRDSGKVERTSKPIREPKAKIVIVSEGKLTEPQYFKDFKRLNRNGLVTVETVGLGAVPLTVVEQAIVEYEKLKRKAKKDGDLFAEAFFVWAVFDRDEHAKFDDAIQRAEEHNIKVAYANPCFEVWGLMHYRPVDGHIERHPAQRELSTVHPSYHHEDNPVLDVASLQGKPYEDALLNANKALIRRQEEEDEQGNPSTTVHLLTEQIRKYGQLDCQKQQPTLQSITDLLADLYEPDAVQVWLYSPQDALDGEIPAKLIGQGCFDKVIALIENLRGGVVI